MQNDVCMKNDILSLFLREITSLRGFGFVFGFGLQEMIKFIQLYRKIHFLKTATNAAACLLPNNTKHMVWRSSHMLLHL